MNSKLLIASNDKNMIWEIQNILNPFKITISTLSTGDELLLSILDKQCDLLILDNQLDDTVGYEMLSVIKKANSKLPIIFIYDWDDYEVSRIVASSGVIIRLIKPINNYTYFLNHIKKIVNRHFSKNWDSKDESLTNE